MQGTLKDYGEKKIISEFIKPLINENDNKFLAGDDCCVICAGESRICLSTDRVPSDLRAFEIGIMDYYDLGYYLAILNISDIFAAGANPIGLLLNLAFPADFACDNFESIYLGVVDAAKEYECKILGGDLSDSDKMNLVATSVGISQEERLLFRTGALPGDYIFCSDEIGITALAFLYYKKQINIEYPNLLSDDELEKLHINFKKPKARKAISELLSTLKLNYRVTCMDNTDGLGQSFTEMSIINSAKYVIDKSLIEVPLIAEKICSKSNQDIISTLFSSGADFQLVGTIDGKVSEDIKEVLKNNGIRLIGKVEQGEGLFLKDNDLEKELSYEGWDYYINEVYNK